MNLLICNQGQNSSHLSYYKNINSTSEMIPVNVSFIVAKKNLLLLAPSNESNTALSAVKNKNERKKKKTKRQKRENNQLLNIMILSSVGLISSSDLLSIHLKYFISSLSYLTHENKRKQNSICHISWKKGRKSIKFSIPF